MLKKLFETVRARCGITQREFVDYFNSSVSFLSARYGVAFVSASGEGISPISDERSPCPVKAVYLDAIGDNIEYLKSGDENRRVDFVAKSEYAYRTVWRERIKNKRIKGDAW